MVVLRGWEIPIVSYPPTLIFVFLCVCSIVLNFQTQSSSSEESRRDEVNGSGSGLDDKKVDVPDPNEPSGFDRGLTPQEIMGATEMDGKILFLMKWLV